MTSGQLLLEGLELMLIGMGLVFVFLVLLIGCIRLMSAILQQVSVPDVTAAVATSTASSPYHQDVDADTLAAIQAAVRQHRAHRA